MRADPYRPKRNAARVSIGLFADIDDAQWKVALYTTFYGLVHHELHCDIRAHIEIRAELVRRIIEEGTCALEDWVDEQLATGKTAFEIYECVKNGFRFDVTPCTPGVEAHRESRTKDRQTIADLLRGLPQDV